MIAAKRLQKLLLMLSSDQDGELVAAARTIGRMLQADDSDWHDLAGRLAVPARAQASAARGYRRSDPRNNRHDNARGNAHSNGGIDWRATHGLCLRHPTMLSQREREFLDTIAHWRGGLTEKQHAWLAAIHARLQNATDANNTSSNNTNSN
jgi:hypothetical protein